MPRTPQDDATEHLPVLDGVRGLAILLVMPHHLRSITEPSGSAASYLWVKLWDAGWIGVELFFILSGFLITRILLSTRTAINYYSGFYARRSLRTLPLFYLTIAVWALLLPTVVPGAQSLSPSSFPSLWLLLSNWTQPFGAAGAGISHIWSLAVEEQFYLVWPFAVLWLTPRSLWRFCIALIVLAPLFRTALLLAGFNEDPVYQFTVCRMDALSLGAAIAIARCHPEVAGNWFSRLTSLHAVVLFVAGAAVSRGYMQNGFRSQTIGYSLLGLSMAAWIAVLVAGKERNSLLAHPWLRAVGKYSYALYLMHVPFKMVVDQAMQSRGWGDFQRSSLPTDALMIALSIAALFVMASLTWRFIEHPMLSYKRYFRPALPAASASEAT